MRILLAGPVAACAFVLLAGCGTPKSISPDGGGGVHRRRGDTNLVVNGDMEDASLVGWASQTPEAATCEVLSAEEPVVSGKRALVLRGTGPWMSVYSDHVVVDPSKTYRASAWVRAKAGKAYIQIDHHGDDQWLGPSKGTQRVAGDEWTKLSVESDLSRYPDATQLSVAVVCEGPNVEVRVDDVVLRALDGAE